MILQHLHRQVELLLRAQLRFEKMDGAVQIDIDRIDKLLSEEPKVAPPRHKTVLQVFKIMSLEQDVQVLTEILHHHRLIQKDEEVEPLTMHSVVASGSLREHVARRCEPERLEAHCIQHRYGLLDLLVELISIAMIVNIAGEKTNRRVLVVLGEIPILEPLSDLREPAVLLVPHISLEGAICELLEANALSDYLIPPITNVVLATVGERLRDEVVVVYGEDLLLAFVTHSGDGNWFSAEVIWHRGGDEEFFVAIFGWLCHTDVFRDIRQQRHSVSLPSGTDTPPGPRMTQGAKK